MRVGGRVRGRVYVQRSHQDTGRKTSQGFIYIFCDNFPFDEMQQPVQL